MDQFTIFFTYRSVMSIVVLLFISSALARFDRQIKLEIIKNGIILVTLFIIIFLVKNSSGIIFLAMSKLLKQFNCLCCV